MKQQLFTQRQMIRRVLTGALLSLSVLATGPAAAVDGKTLPGSACQPLGQSAYSEDVFGRIFNPSTTQFLSVNCPIVRDTVGAKSAGIDQAFVRVFDNNPNANRDVGCTLFSVRDTGQVVDSVSRTTTGSKPNVVQELKDFTDLASTLGGYYNLFCNIPPVSGNVRSGIMMYRVDEND